MRERRAEGVLSWINFWTEFEIRYYFRHYKRSKEHEFLGLKQESMIVSEYKRHFHDLLIFAFTLVPTEQHRIKRLRDGLIYDLRKGLVILYPKIVWELVEATRFIDAVLEEE
jgi:hypothetical protein